MGLVVLVLDADGTLNGHTGPFLGQGEADFFQRQWELTSMEVSL